MSASSVLLVLFLGAAAASLLSLTYEDVSLRDVDCPPAVPQLTNCTGSFQANLEEAINDILSHIEDGNGSLGLPPLDPLVISNIDLNLTNSFIDVLGNLSLEATGLKDLQVPFAKFCMQGFQLFLNFSLPSLVIKGTYAIDGWLGGNLLYIMGNGNLNLTVEGIELYVNLGIKSNTVENHVYVAHLELGLNVASITVHIQGLYHDEPLSEVLSDVLSIALPRLLDIYREPVTCFATHAVADLLDQKLMNLTMSDLTCMVTGLLC